jgi:outer membrane protein assembly factor BamE
MPKLISRLPSRLLLAAVVAVSVSGCGILYKQPIYQGNLIEKSAIEQLQVGMSKQDVQILLGTPSIADPFNKNRWDYTATERTDRRGNTQVKNFVVWFENDAVTKWEGEYFPEQFFTPIRPKPAERRQETARALRPSTLRARHGRNASTRELWDDQV